MGNEEVVQRLLEHVAPASDDAGDERTWQFSQRMREVYSRQMETFDEDPDAKRWRQFYSAGNMPPPDDTRDKAEVAAQMAFYFPTHFFKFQKVMIQQLLEWHSQQPQVNPYPFGAGTVTLIDIGTGVGTALLAAVDLLATWSDVMDELGYGPLGISVRGVAVDCDQNKQMPRRDMLVAMSSLLNTHSIRIESQTDVLSVYPEPECVQHILDSLVPGALGICCISNFLSSRPLSGDQPKVGGGPEVLAKSARDVPNEGTARRESRMLLRAAEFAHASRSVLEHVPFRKKMIVASEVDEQRSVLQSFAESFGPALELLIRRNRIRFLSPPGCYWHSLQDGKESADPTCAVNFWSVADWIAGRDA
jgi:hypothetical protein